MSAEQVLIERRESTAVISLNRPDRRNALNRALIAALDDAVRQAGEDPSVRTVILTGSGTAFCAGMDLDELRDQLVRPVNADQALEDAFQLSRLYERIYSLPKPTIAAVNGAAVAGGAGLMTVCDLAVAVPEAEFGYPEVRRGLVAAMVMPHLLRHVGERTARELLLTGELIDAAEAARVGLINRVVPAGELMAEAMRLSRAIREGGPKALAATRALFSRFSRMEAGAGELAKASAEPRLTEECQQGLTAFFAKTPAPWVL